ncbi:MAG: hypothetical protein QM658_13670 [Gordonia sp. (in: high G+C Gram-positive bacteria)]
MDRYDPPALRLRLRRGAIDDMKTARNFTTDSQVAAALGVTTTELDHMRNGAQISPEMALQFAAVQGTGYNLSAWVEPWTVEKVAS